MLRGESLYLQVFRRKNELDLVTVGHGGGDHKHAHFYALRELERWQPVRIRDIGPRQNQLERRSKTNAPPRTPPVDGLATRPIKLPYTFCC